MAALTPTLSQKGELSVSSTVTTSVGATTDTISNAALLALCDRGDLYDFFNTSFASDAAVVSAFSAKGGLLNVISTVATAPSAILWTRDGGKPSLSLTIAAGAAGTATIRISMSYSASL
jgi:hypothetical protein